MKSASVAIGLFAVVGASPGLARAAYLDAASWSEAVAAQPTGALSELPSYELVTQDAFGLSGPRQVQAPGTWSGSFGCRSDIVPCRGAYAATYVLPFSIVGLAGQLRLNNADSAEDPVLPVPLERQPNGREGYVGFYGDVFAPSRVQTLLWTPGLASADSQVSFSMTGVRVVLAPETPVPEPWTLMVLASGLAAVTLIRSAGLRR